MNKKENKILVIGIIIAGLALIFTSAGSYYIGKSFNQPTLGAPTKIDISTQTNLAADTPLLLTNDTLSINLASSALEIDSTASISGVITFGNLKSCDTIDTSATGLLSCGTDATGAGTGGGEVHGLLNSDWHTDVLLASVSQGSLIIGNSTPKWSSLGIGASNSFFLSNGTTGGWDDSSNFLALTHASISDDLTIGGVNINSTYVPYTGATGIISLGTTDVQFEGGNIFFGAGGAMVFSDNPITTTWVTIDSAELNKIRLGQGLGGIMAILDLTSLATTDKTFTFPDQSGTFALTSNLDPFSTTHASISDDLTIGSDDISFINGVASISSTLWVGGAITGSLTGNASTATALAANGANCPANQYPLGVDASGAVENCTADAGTAYTATNPLSLVGTAFNIDYASASGGGYLTYTNWEDFNGKLSSLSIDTSAELITILTDETGTGHLVFDTSPELTTSFTTTGVFAINPGGALTIGDNGDTLYLNSSDWDIGTTGDMTGIGAITADGLFTGTHASLSGDLDILGDINVTSVSATNFYGTITGDLVCTDCLNATEIEDIYFLTAGDNASASVMTIDSADITSASFGTIYAGTWNGAKIDIGTYTNLTAGDHITLTDDDLDIDDDYLFNTGDTGTWVSITAGFEADSAQITSASIGTLNATTLAFPNDSVQEADIDFDTACAAGNHYYLNGNDLACEADDNTTYTAGDNLTLTGTDFDVDDPFVVVHASASEDFETPSGQITSASIGTLNVVTTLTKGGTAVLITGGTLTSANVCQYDGTGIDCNLPQDGTTDCAAGSVCTGGHTHVGVNEAYGSGWNSDTDTPEKDDIYDWGHLFDIDDDGKVDTLDTIAYATGIQASGSFESDSTVSVSGQTNLAVASISGAFYADNSINFTNLKNCDTLDTNATGVLACGTDNAAAGAAELHGLLNSDIHPDVLLASVSGGSLIVGGETTWQEMTIGASNSFLMSDGTSASWNDTSNYLNLEHASISDDLTLSNAVYGFYDTDGLTYYLEGKDYNDSGTHIQFSGGDVLTEGEYSAGDLFFTGGDYYYNTDEKAASASGGYMQLYGGNSGDAGGVNFVGGNSVGDGIAGGKISFVAGTATSENGDANGGNIEFDAGEATGSGNQGKLIFSSGNGGDANLDTSLLTDVRIFYFPNQAGTFALASMSDSLTVGDIMHAGILTDGTATLTGGAGTGFTSLTSTAITGTHASVSDDLTIAGVFALGTDQLWTTSNTGNVLTSHSWQFSTGQSVEFDGTASTSGNWTINAGAWDLTNATSLKIPTSATLSLTANGMAGIDTTQGQLNYYSDEINVLMASQSFSFVISSGSFDITIPPLKQFQEPATITGYTCAVSGGTSRVVELLICDKTTCGDGGSIDTSLTATTAGVWDDGLLASASIPVGDWVAASTSQGDMVGTVNWITCTTYYKWNSQ